MSTSFPTASVYTDIKGLQSLKNAADNNSPEALREVAKQFEALFIQSLLKNMRAAKLDDGLMSSDQGDMYQDMYDKQLSLTMTRQKGVGLADMLYEQLKYTLDEKPFNANSPVINVGSLEKYNKNNLLQANKIEKDDDVSGKTNLSDNELVNQRRAAQFSSRYEFIEGLSSSIESVKKE